MWQKIEDIIWHFIGVWLLIMAFGITAFMYGLPFWVVMYLVWG